VFPLTVVVTFSLLWLKIDMKLFAWQGLLAINTLHVYFATHMQALRIPQSVCLSGGVCSWMGLWPVVWSPSLLSWVFNYDKNNNIIWSCPLNSYLSLTHRKHANQNDK